LARLPLFDPAGLRPSSLPDVNVPLAGKMPKPQDLVASAYDFAEQLLASQRKFVEDEGDRAAAPG
jgi:hypothetical protein